MMRIIESYMTKNPCFIEHENFTPDGLVIQTLWRPQPSAKVMLHNWNRETQTDVCPHAFIDSHSGDVYQALPFDVKGKHSGTSFNSHTIGVMLCEPANVKHQKGEAVLQEPVEEALAGLYRTYQSAVDLFADLCIRYNIDPLKRIYTYGKRNPEKVWKWMNVPPTIATFRADVLLKMKEMEIAAPTPTIKVRVDVDNLRIRTGPGRDYDSIGKFTGKGEFLITDVQNGSGSTIGWGKLSSGEGWISLDYVTQL